ncbi:MAG TPA: cytochrome c [Bacteroidia bacterium]|nr:cytochrome c [Bacteroidia bacterium]
MNILRTKLYSGLILSVVVALSTSCSKDPSKPGYEYMPDMYRSASFKAYSPDGFFADSASARLPVHGTIPRGYEFFHYPGTREGYDAASRDLVNPIPATELNITEGKRLYSNYCMHCHGESGNGDGSLIQTGKFPPPPSYSTGVSSRGGNMKDLTDGKIYHTITYGLNLMGSHASQVSPEERWKIVLYIHQLQKMGAADTAAGDSTAIM